MAIKEVKAVTNKKVEVNPVSVERTTSTISSAINIIVPILLAFLIAMIPILISKENPATIYRVILDSAFSLRGFARILHYMGPLLLAGLAIMISFKAGLFNMGVESSIIVAGFTTAVLGYQLQTLPRMVLIPLLLVVAIIVGVLTAVIPALLKAYLNVNEMVVTLLLNYAIIEILKALTIGPFRDPRSGTVSTHAVGQNAIFKGFGNTQLTAFFFIAVAVFILVWFLYRKTKLGYEIRSLGTNLQFTEATGIKVRRKIIIIMLLSGAVAGLAGAGWLMSEEYKYSETFSSNPGLGWDGMVISLLGGHAPEGAFIAALFYGILKVGSGRVAFNTDVPAEVVTIIQALLILFLSVKMVKDKNSPAYISIKHLIYRAKEKRLLRKEKRRAKKEGTLEAKPLEVKEEVLEVKKLEVVEVKEPKVVEVVEPKVEPVQVVETPPPAEELEPLTIKELVAKTIPELKAIARENNISGFSSLNKKELVNLLYRSKVTEKPNKEGK